MFFPSLPLLKTANANPLIWSVDWTKVASGYYAIADPSGSGELLYYSDKAYKDFIKTAISNDVPVVVIATPGSTKPHDTLITAPKPSQSSPPPWLSLWGGRLSRMYSSVSRWLIGGPMREKATVKPTDRNIWGLVIRWGRILGLRAGFQRDLRTVTKVSQAILRSLKRLRDHRGYGAVVLQLKVTLLCIHKYLAGDRITRTCDLGAPMRMAYGLPTWLPLVVRETIRKRQVHWIRFITSLMYIYKILDAKHDFLKAIRGVRTPPLSLTSDVRQELELFKQFLFDNFIPLIGGIRPIPQSDGKSWVGQRAGPNMNPAILGLELDALALLRDPSLLESIRKLLSMCGVSYAITALDASIEAISSGVLNHDVRNAVLKDRKGPKFRPLPEEVDKLRVCHSKLQALPEPAGKIRIIAIVDAYTQSALKPLHDDLFRILESLDQDGTHSQNGLIERLRRIQREFPQLMWSSLDISAATDSIPRELYILLIEALYGDKPFAETVLDVMSNRDFRCARDPSGLKHPSLPPTIRYGKGQPMGALASFALLGLLHHAVVQFSAWKAGRFPITSYGIVGDDVVFAEKSAGRGIVPPVASAYLAFWSLMEVKISLPKSFLGVNFFNFLSRTFMGEHEISPASVRAEVTANTATARVSQLRSSIERGWVKPGARRWMSTAFRSMMSCSEYHEFSLWLSSGFLSPLGARLASSVYAPLSLMYRDLGLHFPSFPAYFASLRCEGLLFDLTYRHSQVALSRIGTPGTYLELLMEMGAYLAEQLRDAIWAHHRSRGARTSYLEHVTMPLQAYLKAWQISGPDTATDLMKIYEEIPVLPFAVKFPTEENPLARYIDHYNKDISLLEGHISLLAEALSQIPSSYPDFKVDHSFWNKLLRTPDKLDAVEIMNRSIAHSLSLLRAKEASITREDGGVGPCPAKEAVALEHQLPNDSAHHSVTVT